MEGGSAMTIHSISVRPLERWRIWRGIGGSMGLHRDGAWTLDRIVVDTRYIGLGDVAVFRDSDGDLVAHRVIQMDDTHLVLKGDASESIEKVHKKDVKFIEICVLPGTLLDRIFPRGVE